MYASICWVPRGAAHAKLPKGVKDDVDMDAEARKSSAANLETSGPDGDMEESDDSEVDIDSVLANDLDTLSFHKRNEEDPYLKSDPNAKELFDEEEMEDLVIRPTDALIVTAKSGEDASTLEVHLFDDDPDASDGEEGPYEPHFYVHHDIVLPALPLCTAYARLPVNDESLNLVAVGMFTPGIDIWDVDRVNHLEPLISLGGYRKNDHLSGALAAAASARKHSRGKKKKKPKLRLKEESHKDAVMSLSWNSIQREYLASGSADTTAKVWDVESAHCACTLNHHSDKVQSVTFHPSKAELILTGSFDKTVQLVDVRDSNRKGQWSVEADVEACHWGTGPAADTIIVATEDGFVSAFDPRKAQDGKRQKPMARWRAHVGAASASSVSSDVAGFMVTGGIDKMVKVWDISQIMNGEPGSLVYERPGKAGSLFSLSLCPVPKSKSSNASPFVIAFGGAKGCLDVVDLAAESREVRNRFMGDCSPAAVKVMQSRAVRGTRMANALAQSKQVGMVAEEESSDSGSSGWESDG